MKNNTAKFKKSDKMNVRDYITAAILYVLMFLVYAGVGAPIGMTVAGSLFVFAACAVVWGTIFMLLFTKVNKTRYTPQIYSILFQKEVVL